MFKLNDKGITVSDYVKTLLKEIGLPIKGFDAANRVIHRNGGSKSEARLD